MAKRIVQGAAVEYRRAEYQHSPLGGSMATEYTNHGRLDSQHQHDHEDVKVCYSTPSTPPEPVSAPERKAGQDSGHS
uniref:Uncharacterized protein n=1 Tax=Timema shepardi TaxID=629360 RepID=A0A7R9ATN7_TIMSH|nr:unnamed protein product [Timema shepardi]